jgi:lecithin-cholesterol acyltransferase
METATRLLVATFVAWMLVTVIPGPALADPLTPVVVFPGFYISKLEVQVENQTVASECPTSGTFEVWFRNDSPSTEFSQVC